VRITVAETLNAMLDTGADRLCHAERYERRKRGRIRERNPTSGTCRRKLAKSH
jgi:hypothetical protein